MKDINDNKIELIDLVVSNLYPFSKHIENGDNFETCIENIDIGGSALMRAAAKNHESVAILTSPLQYESFILQVTSAARPWLA